MNNCNFIGRVGAKDAVTRFTQAGKPVTGWSIAVDNGYGDNKQTIWIDCNLWGERGEKVAQYITKGSQIGVCGELGTREHEGKTYLTLRVAEVSLLGGKKEGGERQERSERPARSAQKETAPAQREPGDDFADDDIPF